MVSSGELLNFFAQLMTPIVIAMMAYLGFRMWLRHSGIEREARMEQVRLEQQREENRLEFEQAREKERREDENMKRYDQRERAKDSIDERLVRQLVKSLRFLDESVRDDAAISLVGNLGVLYPVFPTVALVLKSILGDLGETARDAVLREFRSLLKDGSYIVQVPTHLAYAIRIVAQDPSKAATSALAKIHVHKNANALVKRDVILAMAKKNARFWLSPIAKKYGGLSPWERRALIPASYVLGDEGSHWRKNVAHQLNPVDLAFKKWVAKKNSGRQWAIPL